ncbi:Coiled-coil domain-containing protein 94 [Dermatophagoides farinae]|uniref:Splicing factor YJU2 n=1 Tax=Dermatophagoides farinae TaxID=6954 RepID=A0A922HRW2_DERFA|nr:splicing factor YJU2-like [Dermatophagoides farinae]KAH7636918.1 coiled-coil domain-containing protein 94-like [Dermatophagoides farinae]KAH9506541.1 Coiled-coil domain-containing protein 94 [Dermatophagoides farinae]
MSERKVLNKYYPPDFDPSKIPRLRLPKNRQYTVRIMAPCNMRCNTCGDYIARGKKFNARKETVDNEEYLGLKVFRFYFKCPRCMQEITFKTDPKSYDYTVEHGATPNFKALKLAEQQAIEEQKEKEEEERLNPMKMLENRTKASRREMENLEALEDIKEMNQREVAINYDELLRKKKEDLEQELKRQEAEDEMFIKLIFHHKETDCTDEHGESEEVIEEFDETEPNSSSCNEISSIQNEQQRPICTDILATATTSHEDQIKSINNKNKRKLIQKMIVVKKKVKVDDDDDDDDQLQSKNNTSNSTKSNVITSLCDYSGSDSD